MQLEIEEDNLFEFAIFKPSNVKTITKQFKKKKAVLDHLQWYFRPKNSYEPERVDYNCLNILAEFQCYNYEFAHDELHLNNKQIANVLDMFWQLLEFNPDCEEPAEEEQLQLNKENK